MLNQGIIMSLSPSYATIMEKGGLFHHIKPKENMIIGQAIFFTEEDIISQKASLTTSLRPLLAVAAALLLFFIPALYLNKAPYAVVSLDVNPSIELALTKDGTVKTSIARNEDGKKLPLPKLRGTSLETALQSLYDTLVLEGVMQDDTYVLVSYAPLKSKSVDLDTRLHTSMTQSFGNARIVYLPSDKQTYSLANKSHTSLGRYQAQELLRTQAPDIDFQHIDVHTLIKYLDLDEWEDVLEDLYEADDDRDANDASSDGSSNDHYDEMDDDDNDDDGDDDDDTNDDDDDKEAWVEEHTSRPTKPSPPPSGVDDNHDDTDDNDDDTGDDD